MVRGRRGITGAPQVAVLDGLWARRFGLDPAIIGQSIRLGGVPTQVVGVMPADFVFPDTRTDLWLPAQSTRASASFLFTLVGVARLRDGATLERARAEMTQLIADLARTSPNQRGMVATPVGLQQALVGRRRRDALDPARVGRPGAARRVRQRREPVPRPLRGEAARSRGSSGARGEPPRHRALLPGRKRAALDCRRRRRRWRRVGRRAAAARVRSRQPAALPRSPPGRRRARVHVRAEPAGRAGVWRDSAAARRAAGPLAARERTRQHGEPRPPSRPSPADGRPDWRWRWSSLVASGSDASQLSETARRRSRLRRGLGAHVPRWVAERDYPIAPRGRRRASGDARSAVGAPRRHGRVGIDLPASWRNLLRQRSDCRAERRWTASPVRSSGGVASPAGYFETAGIRVLRGRGIERGDVERAAPVVVVNQALADSLVPESDPIGNGSRRRFRPTRGRNARRG